MPRKTRKWIALAIALLWMVCRPLLSIFNNIHATKLGFGQRIAIVTFTTRQTSYMHQSLQNKAQYANRHGYEFIVEFESNSTRGVMWTKFDLLERVINTGKYDWVWWIDFDTLITNMSLPITDVISRALASDDRPDQVDLLATYDCNELNAGSFLTRASSYSIAMFNAIRKVYDERDPFGDYMAEQDAMRMFLQGGSPLAERAARIPQWEINAYPEEIRCYDEYERKWSPGMLAIHFAGAWFHVQRDDPIGYLMTKYGNLIVA
ncbi:hypothetical protein GQ53DRAFT_841589 [Thozetella sp. PMI_491]|nr:hypothetical protein GQ53DRAFT_841589 [Thozetella sp. PMI_491]